MWASSSTNCTDFKPRQDTCRAGLLLPFIPYESSWSTPVRATLYCAGLVYSFMGVAIVAEAFMTSIEKITSKTKKVYLSTDGKGSEPEVVHVQVWNDTIANLTLMALGSSAPEIFLSVIEVFGNNFNAGALGPGAIVGSAAFNLLGISAVCIMSIPQGETRRIRLFHVFLVTAIFSLFAYIWLLYILQFSSPNVVEIWEAALTLIYCPILIIVAWWADRGWGWGIKKESQEGTDINIELCAGEGEKMLTIEKKLMKEDGQVDKEVLLDFYKGLRKFPQLNDSDASILATKKLIDSQHHSQLWYRIGAIRDISGSKKVQPILPENLRKVYDTINQTPLLLNDTQHQKTSPKRQEEPKAIIEFHATCSAVPEKIGKFNIAVVRHGRLDNTVRVRVESFDGTAKAGLDYVSMNQVLTFGPFETEREATVWIIDDNHWEPDEEFFLRLSLVKDDLKKKEAVLGRLQIMEIIILNHDEPGVISFHRRGLLVKETCGTACIEVERADGADGEVSVQWRTIEGRGSAKSPKDFIGGDGTLTFKHGETMRTIEIEIVDDDLRAERDECFEIELSNPTGGARLGRLIKMAVTICNDDDSSFDLDRMLVITSDKIKSLEVHHETWKTQMESALTVNGGDTENATSFDYFMHFLTFGWKVIFALIPPPTYLGGWLCFFCSLAGIGLVTTLAGDLASTFGCLIHLKDEVTAITFLALGTSLPDMFASKTAALSEKYADNAIGNVTGSNSVNVFIGLGFPWLVAALVHSRKGTNFIVQADSLGFTVAVYSAVACAGLGLIVVRRYLSVFGKAELGGPTVPKYICGGFLILLWFVYVTLSSLQTYGHFA